MKLLIASSLILISFIFTSCNSIPDNTMESLISLINEKELSNSTIANGLKESLSKGTQSAVNSLSKKGGFSNSLHKVVIPNELQNFSKRLRQLGFNSQVDFFESKMNEAAEEATKKAAPIFLNAIKSMSLADAKKILMGADNAATNYFKEKTLNALKKEYRPVVKTKMEEIGLVADYNRLINKYNAIPFTSKINFSLDDYITNRSLNSLFDIIEITEKDIRQNPAARTTELLKRVFAETDK